MIAVKAVLLSRWLNVVLIRPACAASMSILMV
jgi:hypothetical protein